MTPLSTPYSSQLRSNDTNYNPAIAQAKSVFLWSRIRSVDGVSDKAEMRLRHLFFEDFLVRSRQGFSGLLFSPSPTHPSLFPILAGGVGPSVDDDGAPDDDRDRGGEASRSFYNLLEPSIEPSLKPVTTAH